MDKPGLFTLGLMLNFLLLLAYFLLLAVSSGAGGTTFFPLNMLSAISRMFGVAGMLALPLACMICLLFAGYSMRQGRAVMAVTALYLPLFSAVLAAVLYQVLSASR